MKVKKGDKVVVIAGKEKGKTGSILRVLPKKHLVVIEGLNVVKKHKRATRGGKGQVVERAMPVHISNVQVADPKTGKPTRVRIQKEKGKTTRVAVKSGSTIA